MYQNIANLLTNYSECLEKEKEDVSYQRFFYKTRHKKPCQIHPSWLRNIRQENQQFEKMLFRKRRRGTKRNVLARKQLSEFTFDSEGSIFDTSFCKKLNSYRKPCPQPFGKLAIPKRIRIRENYGKHRNCFTPTHLEALYNLLTNHKIPSHCLNSIKVEGFDNLRDKTSYKKYKSRCFPGRFLTIQRDGDKLEVVEETDKKKVKIIPKPTKCYPLDLKQIKHGSKPVYKDQETQTIEIPIVKEQPREKKKKPQKIKIQSKNIKPEPSLSVTPKRISYVKLPSKEELKTLSKRTVDKSVEVIKEKSVLSNLQKDFTKTQCQLISLLKQYNCFMGGEVYVFEENQFPCFTLQNMLEKIEKILISTKKSDQVQQIIYDKIFDYITGISPDSLDSNMNDFVMYISKELAKEISHNYKLLPEEIPCGELIRIQSQDLQSVLSINSKSLPEGIPFDKRIQVQSQSLQNVLSRIKSSSKKSSIHVDRRASEKWKNFRNSQNRLVIADDKDLRTKSSTKIQGVPLWMRNIVQCLTKALETLDNEVLKMYDDNKRHSSEDDTKSIIHHCTCDQRNPSLAKLMSDSLMEKPCKCTDSEHSQSNESIACSYQNWSCDHCVKNSTIRGGSDLQQQKSKFKVYPKYKFVRRRKEILHSTSYQATSINTNNTNQDESNESEDILSSYENFPKKHPIKNEATIPEDIFDERYLIAKKFTKTEECHQFENCVDVCNDLIEFDDFSNASVNLIKVGTLIQIDSNSVSNNLKEQSKIYDQTRQSEFSFSEIITRKSRVNKRIAKHTNEQENKAYTSQETNKKLESSSTEENTDCSHSEKNTNSLSSSNVTISLPTKYTEQLLLNEMMNRRLRKQIFEDVTNSDDNDDFEKCKNDNKKCKHKQNEKVDRKRSDDSKNNEQLSQVKNKSRTASNKSITDKNKIEFDEELKLIDDIHNAIEQIKIKGHQMVVNSNLSSVSANGNDDTKPLQLSNILFERTEFVIKVINTDQMSKTYEIELYPHGFKVVCLESLKSWIMFIREITNHSMQWCCWINRNIKKMLFTSSIIKGSAVDSNGQAVNYNCNICNEFIKSLHKDIIKWQTYNRNLEESIKIVLSCCRDKNLSNCNICTECTNNNKLLSIIDQLFYQLNEGLKTIELWRHWLNSTCMEFSHGISFMLENQNTLHTILECNCMKTENLDEENFDRDI